MIRIWIRTAVYITIFILLQVLVFNNIHLFSLFIPFVYIYIILKLPFGMTHSGIVLLSFLTGLVMDVFSNTFGIHAAASTLLGFVRPFLSERFVDVKELPEGSIPSYRLMGNRKFLYYVILLVSIHHISLFTIEAFSFFQPLLMIIRMFSSIFLTSLLIFIIESFNLKSIKSGG